MAANSTGWAQLRFIAHRCGGRLAPENTLDGIHVAAARGFRAVEFDVMLSADGTPILIHDETLERTTNGQGRVAETHAAALRDLLANRGFETTFPSARIPELGETVTLCRRLGMAMNIEIKPAAGYDADTAGAVAAVLGASPPGVMPTSPAPLISSFSETALRVAFALLPDLPRALLVDRVPDDWPERVRALGCSALHVAARQADWGWLGAARAAGVAVRCYTVNDAVGARTLFAHGVDAVFTDALDLFAGGIASATSGYMR